MEEYESLFCMALHNRLKEKLIGKVYCEVNESDQLYVSITSYQNVKWEYRLDNFSRRIQLVQITSDGVANDIIKKYKGIILRKYFV